MPSAKMGLVDYISRHAYQKGKRVSAFDEKYVFAKLGLNSVSANTFKLTSNQHVPYLHNLLKHTIPHRESLLILNLT